MINLGPSGTLTVTGSQCSLGSFCREDDMGGTMLGWGGSRNGGGMMLPLEEAWEAKSCMSHIVLLRR